MLIYEYMPAFARLGDSSMKGVARNSLISGDVTVGFSQLRVRTRFGLSGLLRYANMKSVPGLVTIISWPSNLTF